MQAPDNATHIVVYRLCGEPWQARWVHDDLEVLELGVDLAATGDLEGWSVAFLNDLLNEPDDYGDYYAALRSRSDRVMPRGRRIDTVELPGDAPRVDVPPVAP